MSYGVTGTPRSPTVPSHMTHGTSRARDAHCSRFEKRISGRPKVNPVLPDAGGTFGSLTDGSLGRVIPRTRNHVTYPTTGILYVSLFAGDQMDVTVADGL